jgi:hypothetical protein
MPKARKKTQPLWKTTIVIWSEQQPPDGISLEEIGREADEGSYYCSRQGSEIIDQPSRDPAWDGTGFFEVGE